MALPDGVYLNLEEADYFAQPDRLGSTDLVTLYQRREGWWWQSRHNPDHKPRDRDGLTFGSALHAILLEGVAAYEARYCVQPEKSEYIGLVDTIEEMSTALSKAGHVYQVSKMKKDDWRTAMRAQLPDVPVWSNIMDDYTASLGLRTPISAVDDRAVRYMREVATDPARNDNEDVRKLFDDEGHPPLAEVTVLWTEEGGVQRRGRIDRMYPGFDLDLKSLQNWSGRSLHYYTGDLIARRGYDIQRADHYEARRVGLAMVREGLLHGGTPEQRRWIEAIAEADHLRMQEGGAYINRPYVWLFFQKPDMVTGVAPVLFPVWDDSRAVDGEAGTLFSGGMLKREAALNFYRDQIKRFGLTHPWASVSPLHYTDEAYEPRVFLPHWINEVDPHTTEQETEDADPA